MERRHEFPFKEVVESEESLARLDVLLARLESLLNDLPEPLNHNQLVEVKELGLFARPYVIHEEHGRVVREKLIRIRLALRGLTQHWGKRRNLAQGPQVYCLGYAVIQISRRPFLRGYVDLRRSVAVGGRVPEGLALCLLAVPGIRDQLERENHGHWGYHYHYVDSTGRRSDTLLTFDRRSVNALEPTLVWERHAVGDKFKAKAAKWGQEKRQSIYGACHPDTRKWPLSAFKQPAGDAAPVWP